MHNLGKGKNVLNRGGVEIGVLGVMRKGLTVVKCMKLGKTLK